tara:strand:- start:317 stop:514 length:198 start_codon:yes stop_codon:yes gene_type:complete
LDTVARSAKRIFLSKGVFQRWSKTQNKTKGSSLHQGSLRSLTFFHFLEGVEVEWLAKAEGDGEFK